MDYVGKRKLKTFAPSKSVKKLEEIGKQYITTYLKKKSKTVTKETKSRELNFIMDTMRSGYEDIDDLVKYESISTQDSTLLVKPTNIQGGIINPLRRDYSILVVVLIAFALHSKKEEVASIDLLNMVPQMSEGNDCIPKLMEVSMLYLQKTQDLSLLEHHKEDVTTPPQPNGLRPPNYY